MLVFARFSVVVPGPTGYFCPYCFHAIDDWASCEPVASGTHTPIHRDSSSFFSLEADLRYLVLMVTLFSMFACGPKTETPSSDPAAAQAANNRGVALMGRFDYEGAVKAFEEAVAALPENDALKVNLGIATLNRRQEGDEAAALTLFEEIIGRDPGKARAHYCAGLLKSFQGLETEAKTHFEAVAALDGDDPFVHYHLGQIAVGAGQAQEALTHYQRSIELDPYFRSAYYGAFRAAQSLGQSEEAATYMSDFQKLQHNPRARLFEVKYTRMGPKAEVLAAALTESPLNTLPSGPLFFDSLVQRSQAVSELVATADMTVCDVNGDGLVDVFVAGVDQAEDGLRSRLYLRENDQYNLAADHVLAQIPDINSALWGDFDNDGDTDVFLCRNGKDQLLLRDGDSWSDQAEAAGVDGGGRNTIGGAVFDADHDGDLDILVLYDKEAPELFSNNYDGTFRELGESQGLQAGGPARAVVTADFDGDRDTDILLNNLNGSWEAYINDRLWSYRRVSMSVDQALISEKPLLADYDHDGSPEWSGLSFRGIGRREVPGREGGEETLVVPMQDISFVGLHGFDLVDFDGDGMARYLVPEPGGFFLWGGDKQRQGKVPAVATDLRTMVAWSVVNLDPAKGPGIAVLFRDGAFSYFPPGTGRFPFMQLGFSGKEDDGAAMRSNASGIGTEYAVRLGSRWIIGNTLPAGPKAGSDLQPVSIGLLGRENADFVALEWSDGVYQTETGLAAGQTHRIVETQRQLSSCPVLYSWDGKGFRFVSDLLGVGGLGYGLGKGVYADPRPWEFFRMPDGALVADGDALRLKIGEPMEEATYLDQAVLRRYDLPEGWDVVPDDRMATGKPAATGEPIYYRTRVMPKAATNDREEDVLSVVLNTDGVAAPVGKLDRRFLGRLEQEHRLQIDFEQDLSTLPGQAVLVVDGWVEYPYSQTNFSAWQAGAVYEPPSLDAVTQDGQVIELFKQFGYPAGMPRRMALPLGRLPRGTVSLALRTNLEVYWDAIFVVAAEEPEGVEIVELPLQEAVLSFGGYPKRTTGPQRYPILDYQQRTPFWDTRYQEGFYTRYGDVLPLVAEYDETTAIFGPGDELDLVFHQSRPQPETGKFVYILEVRGWCKDMDLFTKDGEHLTPIPGNPSPQKAEMAESYQTRYQAGR